MSITDPPFPPPSHHHHHSSSSSAIALVDLHIAIFPSSPPPRLLSLSTYTSVDSYDDLHLSPNPHLPKIQPVVVPSPLPSSPSSPTYSPIPSPSSQSPTHRFFPPSPSPPLPLPPPSLSHHQHPLPPPHCLSLLSSRATDPPLPYLLALLTRHIPYEGSNYLSYSFPSSSPLPLHLLSLLPSFSVLHAVSQAVTGGDSVRTVQLSSEGGRTVTLCTAEESGEEGDEGGEEGWVWCLSFVADSPSQCAHNTAVIEAALSTLRLLLSSLLGRVHSGWFSPPITSAEKDGGKGALRPSDLVKIPSLGTSTSDGEGLQVIGSSYYGLHLLDPLMRQWSRAMFPTAYGMEGEGQVSALLGLVSCVYDTEPPLEVSSSVHCILRYDGGRLVISSASTPAWLTASTLLTVTSLLHISGLLHRTPQAGWKTRVWRLHLPLAQDTPMIVSAACMHDQCRVALIEGSEPGEEDPYCTAILRAALRGRRLTGPLFTFTPFSALMTVMHTTPLMPTLLPSILHIQAVLTRIQQAVISTPGAGSHPYEYHPDLLSLREVKEFGMRGADGEWVMGRMRRDGTCVVVVREEEEVGEEEEGDKGIWGIGWKLIDLLHRPLT